jgi:hypothetical protein
MIISIQASHTTTTKMEEDSFRVLGCRLEGIKWCNCCMLGRGVQHNIQFLWRNCQVTTITPKTFFHRIDTQVQTQLRIERGKTMSGNTCMIWELIAVTWWFDSFLNDGIIHSAINKNLMKRHLMNSDMESRTNNTFWNKWKTQLIIVALHHLFSAILVFGRLGIFQHWMVHLFALAPGIDTGINKPTN